MRLAVIFLALAATLSGAPTISNVFVDTVESHCARFGWTTNVSSTNNYIKLDTTPTPTTAKDPDGKNTSGLEHGYTFCGLAAATTYYYEVCSTNNGETCTSAGGSFTTLAAEAGYATLPVAPAEVTVGDLPTVTGNTYNVAADCSDLQAQLNAAASATNTANHEVVIPAGTTCLGRYSLPGRSGATGWVTVRTDGVIPPFGSKTSIALGSNNAKIISPFVAVEYYQTGTPGSGSEVGQAWVDSDSSNPAAFLHFWNGSSWAAASMSSSAADPSGACTAGDLHYNTGTADAHSRVSWCDNAGQWRRIYLDTATSETPYAGIYAADNAVRYRIVGITVEPFRVPVTYAATLPVGSGNGDQKPSQSYCLTYTKANSQYIIYDRVILDGVGYPNRTRRAFCFWEGQHIAIVGSLFNEINYWRPTTALETTPSAIINFSGQGPFRIENSDFTACSGICIMMSDDGGSNAAIPTDLTIAGNTFYVPATFNLGDSTSNGRRYDFRHFIECKRCSRVKIWGNVMDGGFPVTNQAAQIAMTPRNGNCATKQNAIRINDVDIAYNWSRYSAQFLLLSGQNDSQNNCNTKNTVRVALRNNLVENTGVTESGDGDGVGSLDLNGQIMNIGLGLQDFSVLHNAFIRVSSGHNCCNANMISHGWDGFNLNSRLWVDGNIYTSLASKINGYWGIMGGGVRGTAALNLLWKAGASTSYFVSGNAMQIYYNGTFIDAAPDGAYPAGNYRSEVISNFTNALYQRDPFTEITLPKFNSILAAGSATARAADGSDSGPDWIRFEQEQRRVYNARALSITSSGATVYWTAPDSSTACTVEYGTSATPGTGSRVTDTPSSRFRSRALTGLSAGTTYYYRIYCGRMISGSFRTI